MVVKLPKMSREEEDGLPGPEDGLKAFQHPAGHLGEPRTAVVHGGFGHGPQDPVRDVGGARDLEEVTSGPEGGVVAHLMASVSVCLVKESGPPKGALTA